MKDLARIIADSHFWRERERERERDEKCSWYIINRSPLYVINIFSADSVNLPLALGREQVQ